MSGNENKKFQSRFSGLNSQSRRGESSYYNDNQYESRHKTENKYE